MGWMPENARKMFDKLIDFALQLGRDPSFEEVAQNPALPHPNDYAFYFGSYTEALKQAHRIAFIYKKREPPLPPGKIFSEEEEKDMSRRSITNEEYIVAAFRLQKELGHFPTVSEVRQDKHSPSVTSYEKHFGADWNGVKAAIIRTAKNLGITEDNFESIELPKQEAKPAKPAPQPETLQPETPQTKTTQPETIQLISADLAKPSILAELAAEPPTLSEAEPEGNKLISLLPQTRISSPKVEGYATVFVTKGLIPLQKTVVGIPVTKSHNGLNLVLNGRAIPFPEPSENIFYIVERKIASIARMAGRESYDLLIPEKFDRNSENEMTITEFSIL
ncbi:hypothetical protein IJ847_00080 [Candidatus Saccharibacteria bacterium]|nr:hypothetical protein [Candidatus Saccharibacteria bacterium]